MQKEYFKTLFFPVILLTLLTGALFTTSANAALERKPYLQSVSDTRMVMRWRTTSASDSRVSYGLTLNNLNTNVDDTKSSTEHEVVITGLTPNTKYFYSVGATTGAIEAGNDASHYFITAPNVGSKRSIRIWAIGDAGTGTTNQQQVRNAYYNLDNAETDVILALGDNAYNNGTDSEYTNNFFNIYQTIFSHAPVWATRGNHETDANLGVYTKSFSHPKNAESGGAPSGTELYYSFNYGNIHFVCLDSFTQGNFNGTGMYTWLETDLASTTQEWIIAYWHHPPYSLSNKHNSDTDFYMKTVREKANPILEKYGVDLQLGGHNHFYSRTFLINNHYGVSSTYDPAIHAIDSGDGKELGDGVYQKGSNPKGAVYVLAGSSGKLRTNDAIHHPANFTEIEQLASLVIDVNGDRMDIRTLNEKGALLDNFSITKTSPPVNQAPTVNAGTNQSAATGASVNLNGTVSDDGKPSGTLTYTWSKISGPGSATFANANAVDTTVTFSAAGSYVVQLTADDGALTTSANVTITVTDPPVNQAPTVNAGTNQNTTTNTTVSLNGTVTDDGKPSGTLTYTWSKISGPGTATFANANAVDTTVTFSAAGSYVVQLTADDGALTTSANVTITVTNTPPANQAPSVNAGTNQSATTGATVSLNGTVTDDGLPNNTLTYIWRQVSGPGTATFANTNAVDTTVAFSAAGSYVLRLTANDSALPASADITITVTDATPANQVPPVDTGTNQNSSSQTSKVDGGGAAFNIGLLISFSIILLLRWLMHHGLSFRAGPARRKAQQII